MVNAHANAHASVNVADVRHERFPNDLLKGSKQARHRYFCDWMVEHPKLVETKEALLNAIRYPYSPGGHSLIQVFGCTGVGKTTLRQWVERLLLKEAEADMQATPGYLPVISVVTPLPDQGPFNWRDLYVQALSALGEPKALIARKKLHPQLAFVSNDKLAVAPRTQRPELRLALVSGLYHRDVRVCFFDEAQHFQMVSQAQRLQGQMDNLKWLAEVSQTIFVTIGTFDLLNLTDLSGQLSRRSISIHFERYRAECGRDYTQFASVIYAFQRHLPLAEEPDLVGLADYLYERSLGCVGVLKDWLTRAYTLVLEHEERTLTQPWLDKAINLQKIATIAHEIASGEMRLKTDETLLEDIRRTLKLGLKPMPASTPTSKPEGKISRHKSNGNATTTGNMNGVVVSPVQTRVGQRASKRDKVGV